MLFVALAGMIGVLVRYSINFVTLTFNGVILSTFVVNSVGSYAIGLFFQCWQTGKLSHEAYIIITAGFVGGLTTFSGYALNLAAMVYNQHMLSKDIWCLIAYLLLMPVCGMGLVLLGMLSVSNASNAFNNCNNNAI